MTGPADPMAGWPRTGPAGDDILAVWFAAEEAAKRTRDETRRRIHNDPVAHLMASMMGSVLARHQPLPTSGGWPFSQEERDNAVLDFTGTILGLLQLAREGRI